MPSQSADLIFSDLEVESKAEATLSLGQFSTIVQSHLTCIAEAQNSLQLALIPLTIENSDVQPVQCEKAIKSLSEMNVPIGEFCKLFLETQRLPIVFIPLRYRLLVTLHLIEEKTCELIELIDGYRMFRMTSSKRGMHERREIYEGFKMLLQHIGELSDRVEIVKDEARFQEQKLTSSSRGRLVHILKGCEDSTELP